jgi:hypothetical protein
MLINSIGNPILDMELKKKCQSTLSKALEKSSLRKMESYLDFLAHERVSWVSSILSKMKRFFMNVLWSWLMISKRGS